MKRVGFLLVLSLIGIIGINAQTTSSDEVIELFNDVLDFSDANINKTRPVSSIIKTAARQADTIYFLTKDNVSSVMSQAKKYKHCIIAVETHTVVLVNSWSKVSKSGTWNYYLPYGVGCIQRNELIKKEDYIKNLIGTPDFQRRSVFLYDRK